MSGPFPSPRVFPDIPGVWRGRTAEQVQAVSTGIAALDAVLPGHGWPIGALTELMPFTEGIGELQLIFPALRQRCQEKRSIVFIGSPYILYAPALVNAGLPLSRILCIDKSADDNHRWAAEQILREGGAGAVVLWSPIDADIPLRRLQLAAEEGKALAFLYRPAKHLGNASPAAVRLGLHAAAGGIRIDIAKARGGSVRRSVVVSARAVS